MRTLTITGICFTLMFVSNLCQSQCYTVIKVKGNIIVEKTGQNLKVNDEICDNDKLIFPFSDAVAALHSTKSGRYIIKGESSDDNKSNFSKYVKSVLIEGNERLGSRGYEDLFNGLSDRFLVINSGRIVVPTNMYKMDEDNYFYIKYNLNSKSINKRLPFSNDTLIISADAVSSNGENLKVFEKVENVSLYYYQKVLSQSSLISKFKLSLPDEKELMVELQNYANYLKANKKEQQLVKDTLLNYLYDLYGDYSVEDVEKWLGKNIVID